MTDPKISQDRANLLAAVAEMYYLEDRDQAEIAKAVQVTRSMVSRMLKEAREKGIVEIRVHRPLRSEYDLQVALIERFGLQNAYVVAQSKPTGEVDLGAIGSAAAMIFRRYLTPGIIVGLSWGTSVSATVDALNIDEPLQAKIVQLVGALGARYAEYDGYALVTRLAEKLGGEAYFLNAPFVCPNEETAVTLMDMPAIKETISLGRQVGVALMGVGSTRPQNSSFYLAGYVPLEEINQLLKEGAVGDVCGINFDQRGNNVCNQFCKRLVTIRLADLMAIPIRIGVAGGLGKAEPILGALRGGYVNVLVTDSITAKKVLDLAGEA